MPKLNASPDADQSGEAQEQQPKTAESAINPHKANEKLNLYRANEDRIKEVEDTLRRLRRPKQGLGGMGNKLIAYDIETTKAELATLLQKRLELELP